mmetsp:Transcript_7791/g.34354  ORF Transcript_7791/g.34354 Transcript_7791/m.34354 type:complete len:236 (-) Transcript_7791:388-1095(-)
MRRERGVGTQSAHREARHQTSQARRFASRPGVQRVLVPRVDARRGAPQGWAGYAREASKGRDLFCSWRRRTEYGGPDVRGRRRRAALGSAARSGAQGGGAAQGRVTGDRRSRVGGETPAQVGGGAGDVGGSFRGGVGGCRVRGEAVRRGERAHATAEGQGTHADDQDPSRGGQRAGDTHERVHRPRRVRPSHPIEHRVFERRRRPVALAGGGAPARRPQRPRGSDPGRGGSGHEA